MKLRVALAMRKTTLSLVLIALCLTGCGTDLWGADDPYLTQTYEPTAIVAQPSLAATEVPTETASPLPPSATPTKTLTPSPTTTPTPAGPTNTPRPMILYKSQSGDSLAVVAIHFGVQPGEISAAVTLPTSGFIDPDTRLVIPNRLDATSPSQHLIPDSEVVYSPTAINFDTNAYVKASAGKLASYSEYLIATGWISGGDDVQKIAVESSINPRLLLALLQYQGGWVQGPVSAQSSDVYPLGFINESYKGLYEQMRLAIQELAAGYYGWRTGSLTTLTFPDGQSLRLAPGLNAGTVAVEYLFAQHQNYPDWLKTIDPTTGFMALYQEMFGDPWARDQGVSPLFPPGLAQPVLTLPFVVGQLWSFTGGPHPAWESETSLAALDFAPASDQSGCVPSDAWEVASAPGVVVRSDYGLVVLDLDGDGHEQTGWDLLYMHVGTKDRVPVGTWLKAGDHVGHPSCEGGEATGTHLHFARKYNGEWVGAGGPLPFVLSGWVAHAGAEQYEGTLTKGSRIIVANQNSPFESDIIRLPGE
jgi:murein DD-endopeptidase MepM/ murein hydrolase activator NlpD